MLLVENSGERRTPRNFGLLLTLLSTHRVTCHEPNEIGYAKIGIEANSGTAVSSFSLSQIVSSLIPGMTVRS